MSGNPKPFVIGLTGSIGMGKSETAKLFAQQGIPVFDADAAIAQMYRGEAAALIEKAFPGTTQDGKVDRECLSRKVTADPLALKRLEELVHPLLARRQQEFVQNSKAPVVVLDIPLLLETGTKVDAVVVASAAEHVQRERVLARPGMTEEKFHALKSRQFSDAQKRAKAHYVVVTDKGIDHAREQVKMILADLKDKHHA